MTAHLPDHVSGLLDFVPKICTFWRRRPRYSITMCALSSLIILMFAQKPPNLIRIAVASTIINEKTFLSWKYRISECILRNMEIEVKFIYRYQFRRSPHVTRIWMMLFFFSSVCCQFSCHSLAISWKSNRKIRTDKRNAMRIVTRQWMGTRWKTTKKAQKTQTHCDILLRQRRRCPITDRNPHSNVVNIDDDEI